MKSVLKTAAFALLFAFATSISNAQTRPTTPLAFNEFLVDITDSLFIMGQKWGTKFNEVHASKSYSDLIPVRKQMENFIVAKQKLVQNLKDVSGSEELRKAHLEFLGLELQLVKEGFVPLEKLTAQSSTEAVNTAIQNLRNSAAKENTYLEKVVKAQEAYAAKNGFTIEKSDNTSETDD